MTEQRRKRGRERVYDAQRTREAIVSAAGAAFAEHGFDGASMDAIARASGYNKSLLFQYFGDKLGLYTQVLKRADQEMGELIAHAFTPLLEDETIASDASQFREFLKSIFGAFFDYMVEHPHLMRLLNWEQANGWQTFTRIAAQFEPDDLTKLDALFFKAREAGLLRAGLDTAVMLVLIEQICWSTPATLPLYEPLVAGRHLASDTALTYVRAHIIDFLVAGIMGDHGASDR